MNSKPILVSLVLNLVLAGAFVWAIKTKSSGPAAAPTAADAQASVKSAANGAKKKADGTTETIAPAAPAKAFDWRLVESEDYKKYIANLRSIGCPEETIRDIIIADVNKLFASRKRAIQATSTNKFQFWKPGNPMAGMFDAERMEKNQELAKEKRALIKELLGVEPEEKPDMMAGVNDMVSSMLDFLPDAKQGQVMDVMMKYQAKLAKSMGNGQPDAEDMKQMQKVQKDMEAEMASLMSPQELEDYQLRMSQTSMMMRMQLASFDPSEKEFRDIFKLRKSYDDEFSPFGMGAMDKADRDKAAAAKKELDTKVKDMLGDGRYADYERAQDYTYQGIAKAAEKNGLPKDDAVKLYDVKKLAEAEAKKIRADKALTSEQRTAALQGIRTETESSFRTVLKDKGFESYQKQPGAYWLRNISPDPKPGAKTE